jgi:hypothetical protein
MCAARAGDFSLLSIAPRFIWNLKQPSQLLLCCWNPTSPLMVRRREFYVIGPIWRVLFATRHLGIICGWQNTRFTANKAALNGLCFVSLWYMCACQWLIGLLGYWNSSITWEEYESADARAQCAVFSDCRIERRKFCGCDRYAANEQKLFSLSEWWYLAVDVAAIINICNFTTNILWNQQINCCIFI